MSYYDYRAEADVQSGRRNKMPPKGKPPPGKVHDKHVEQVNVASRSRQHHGKAQEHRKPSPRPSSRRKTDTAPSPMFHDKSEAAVAALRNWLLATSNSLMLDGQPWAPGRFNIERVWPGSAPIKALPPGQPGVVEGDRPFHPYWPSLTEGDLLGYLRGVR